MKRDIGILKQSLRVGELEVALSTRDPMKKAYKFKGYGVLLEERCYVKHTKELQCSAEARWAILTKRLTSL